MRRLAKMTASELRDETDDGIQTCARRIKAAQLLDRIDEALDFQELKDAVLALAQLVTGED